MSRAWVLLLVVGVAIGVAAARGRGGGGARGGYNRAGPAAGGSFGQGRRTAGTGGGFSARGPAAGGTLGDDYGRNVGDVGGGAQRVDRDAVAQQRREQFGRLGPPDSGDRQNEYENRQDYYDRHEDDHDHPIAAAVVVGAAIGAAATVPEYWTAPCEPVTVVVGGTTYYQCDTAWYVRAYSGGDVTYVMVNPPAGY